MGCGKGVLAIGSSGLVSMVLYTRSMLSGLGLKDEGVLHAVPLPAPGAVGGFGNGPVGGGPGRAGADSTRLSACRDRIGGRERNDDLDRLSP